MVRWMVRGWCGGGAVDGAVCGAVHLRNPCGSGSRPMSRPRLQASVALCAAACAASLFWACWWCLFITKPRTGRAHTAIAAKFQGNENKSGWVIAPRAHIRAAVGRECARGGRPSVLMTRTRNGNLHAQPKEMDAVKSMTLTPSLAATSSTGLFSKLVARSPRFVGRLVSFKDAVKCRNGTQRLIGRLNQLEPSCQHALKHR